VADVLFVLADTDHKSGTYVTLRILFTYLVIRFFIIKNFIFKGFKMQCNVLQRMFNLVETGAVQSPLFNPSEVQDPNMTNQRYLREYVMNILQNAFPHLQRF